MLTKEQEFYKQGYKLIVGVDEAGRGPLCGPVVAGACILPIDYNNDDINDSKKLSELQREKAYEEITANCIAFGVGIVDPETIDQINVYEASRLAMKLAIKNMNHEYDLVITDAMPIYIEGKKVLPFIKGDATYKSIAAGSIIAKVTRDRIMNEYAKKYPMYHLEQNKGYPTKEHIALLNRYGPIKGFYRYTYGPVRNCIIKQEKLF